MSMLKEFKEFASKGNLVDLAVGIVIGGAFGKIISSMVSDVIMPPIGLLLGGVNFTDIKIHLKEAIVDASGKIVHPAVTMNIGNFIQVLFDFTIIALCIFGLVKAMNRFKKKEEPVVAPTPNQEVLLAEIRDLLKSK
jgi:large conductance mechanosensitive channel